MKTWSDFVPLIVGKAPDCPSFEIEDEAKKAASVFFADTRVWRSQAVLVGTTVAGQADYTIPNLPTGAKAVGVPMCWVGGAQIDEALPRDIEAIDPFTGGQPIVVEVVEPDKLRLSPAPIVAGQTITAKLVYAPADNAEGIPDDLFARYSDVIVLLALAELLVAPGKPWSAPAIATFYQQKYDRDALHAATQAGPIRRNRLRVKKC